MKKITKRQKQIKELYDELKSERKVAKKLGINRSAVNKALKAVRKKTSQVLDNHTVSGVSTLYNKNDEIILQWIKTKPEHANLKEKINILVDEYRKKIKGKSVIYDTPKVSVDNEIVIFPIGDLHLGMYSWVEETGNDYDCDIARQIILDAMFRLVNETEPREKAVIVSLGDWFHSDTVQNKTLASGNILDIDTRWQRVFRIGVNILKYLVDKCLTKFETVEIYLISGNHDYHTSYALSLIIEAYYMNNERVRVDTGVNPFRYFTYGKTLIGMTHGIVKENILPGVMAADKPKEWGESVFRTWYIGHKHQHKLIEYPGCTVEIFPTLAGKDAWTNSMGYRSKRELHKVILHKEYGEVGRSIVNINMLGA